MLTASLLRSVRPLVKTVAIKLGESFKKRHGRFISYKNESGEPLVKISIIGGKFYEGEAKDDKELTAGKLTDISGTVTEGIFQNKTLVGLGKATYVDGSIYFGEFLDNLPHGEESAHIWMEPYV